MGRDHKQDEKGKKWSGGPFCVVQKGGVGENQGLVEPKGLSAHGDEGKKKK